MATKRVWATDANYPAGGDPWSATPTKVAPTADEIGGGFVPEIPPTAQGTNWWLNRVDLQLLGALLGKDIMPGPRADGTTDPDFPAENALAPSTAYAYTPSVGAAHPKQGSTNAKVKIAAGVLFQIVGGSVLAYEFDGTDEVAIANGDAANPRVDLVQLKLELLDGDVIKTLNVKQGVAAAAPNFPAPDAGFVPIAAVYVNKLYVAAAGFLFIDSTTNGKAVLWDLRMPLAAESHLVWAKDGVYDPAIWARSPASNLGRSLVCANSTAGDENTLFVPCPVARGRLLGITIIAHDGNDVTTISNLVASGAGFVYTAMADVADLVGTDAVNFEKLSGGFDYIEAGTLGTPAVAVGAHGPPIWCNGRRCQIPEIVANAGPLGDQFRQVGVHFKALTNLEVSAVIFRVAQGL